MTFDTEKSSLLGTAPISFLCALIVFFCFSFLFLFFYHISKNSCFVISGILICNIYHSVYRLLNLSNEPLSYKETALIASGVVYC